MKRPRASTRRPHPDPLIEARLQHIISLNLAIGERRQTLARLSRKLRRTSWADDRKTIAKEIVSCENGINDLHDHIDKLFADLSDTDLAYL